MMRKTEPNTSMEKITFTERELQIIKGTCEEKTIKEIGSELGISPETVKKIRQRVREKIGAKNTIGLVMYAIANKLYSIP